MLAYAAKAHGREHAFASGSADSIRRWLLPQGRFMQRLGGHDTIINALATNEDDVLVSGGDDGTMHFWDWQSGTCFQKLKVPVQPGSLDVEAGIYAMSFDQSGSRLLTCEADKTIKFWKEDSEATPETHPVPSPGALSSSSRAGEW